MSKATKKVKKITEPKQTQVMQNNFEERGTNFEKDLGLLMQKHQVGIRAFNGKYGPMIERVDLVALAQENEKAGQ